MTDKQVSVSWSRMRGSLVIWWWLRTASTHTQYFTRFLNTAMNHQDLSVNIKHLDQGSLSEWESFGSLSLCISSLNLNFTWIRRVMSSFYYLYPISEESCVCKFYNWIWGSSVIGTKQKLILFCDGIVSFLLNI